MRTLHEDSTQVEFALIFGKDSSVRKPFQVGKGGMPLLQRSVPSLAMRTAVVVYGSLSKVSLKTAKVDDATLERGHATLPNLRAGAG
jgi:hypothetical protein